MEKTVGYRYSHLWTDDKNSISPEKIDCKDRISKGQITWIRREIEVVEIPSGDSKETTIDLGRENDTSIWGEFTTKTTTNRGYEIRNRKSRGDHERANNLVLEIKKRASNIQEKILLPEKAWAARKVIKEDSIGLHKSDPSR